MRYHFAVVGLGVGLAALCLSGSPSPALPTPDTQDTQDRARQPFVLEAGSHDVKEVLARFAKYLGYNLLYEDNDFQNPANKINLIGRLTVDGKGCEELMTQLAYAKDFAIVPVDLSKKLYQVIFIRGPKRSQITTSAQFMMPAEVRNNSRKVVYVTTVRKLKHVDAAKATAHIRPFFAGGGAGANSVQWGTAGTEDAVLLQGFARQVAEALRLLDEVDQPGRQKLPQVLNERLQSIELRTGALEKRSGMTRKK